MSLNDSKTEEKSILPVEPSIRIFVYLSCRPWSPSPPPLIKKFAVTTLKKPKENGFWYHHSLLCGSELVGSDDVTHDFKEEFCFSLNGWGARTGTLIKMIFVTVW
jgi:hypothetical protein